MAGEPQDADGDGFEVGSALVFFNSPFTSADKKISGNKCFIVYDGENVNDYTISAWDNAVEWYEGDQEFEPVYTLKGKNLTIMECDLDRYVGTIAINGNEMTFTYKYQNWNYDSGTMTSESKTYVSTFRKK